MSESDMDIVSESASSQHDEKQQEKHPQEGQPHECPSSASYHSLSWAFQTYLRDDRQEQNHWEDVCRSFRQYSIFAMEQWACQQYRLHALPEVQRRVLPDALKRDTPDFLQRATEYKDAAIRNQFCLDCILTHAGQPHSTHPSVQTARVTASASAVTSASTSGWGVASYATDGQMSKVSSVLKSLVRDWSIEGKAERDMAYVPLLQSLKRFLPIPTTTPNATTSSSSSSSAASASEVKVPRVCVPGAGVGRLACEICALGYAVQGNEFSLYMLLASDFILNGQYSKPETPLKISPWLLETRNVVSSKEPLRTAHIPDVDPYAMLAGEASVTKSSSHTDAGDTAAAVAANMPDFSMAAGEFVSIYGVPRERGQWDAVVSCFFLDASPSVVEYLQVIYSMLKPGGFLLNFGPLLWHWSGPAMRPEDKTFEDYQERYSHLDKKYLTSIDLSWDDVEQIMKNIGFVMLEVEQGKRALYTADTRSMMNMEYRCVYFCACKPPVPVASKKVAQTAKSASHKQSSRPMATPSCSTVQRNQGRPSKPKAGKSKNQSSTTHSTNSKSGSTSSGSTRSSSPKKGGGGGQSRSPKHVTTTAKTSALNTSGKASSTKLASSSASQKKGPGPSGTGAATTATPKLQQPSTQESVAAKKPSTKNTTPSQRAANTANSAGTPRTSTSATKASTALSGHQLDVTPTTVHAPKGHVGGGPTAVPSASVAAPPSVSSTGKEKDGTAALPLSNARLTGPSVPSPLEPTPGTVSSMPAASDPNSSSVTMEDGPNRSVPLTEPSSIPNPLAASYDVSSSVPCPLRSSPDDSSSNNTTSTSIPMAIDEQDTVEPMVTSGDPTTAPTSNTDKATVKSTENETLPNG